MYTYKPVKSKNHGSKIVSRVTRFGNVCTETTGRDDDFSVAVTKNRNGKTQVYIFGLESQTTHPHLVIGDQPAPVQITVRQARTIARVLEKHAQWL
jgi:hypothetical protein